MKKTIIGTFMICTAILTGCSGVEKKDIVEDEAVENLMEGVSPQKNTESEELDPDKVIIVEIEPTEEVEETTAPTEEILPVETNPPEENFVETEPINETIPKKIFEDVDEYLFSSTELNIREGPGTEYPSIGVFALNEKVHRLGLSDIGWSKVEFNGSIGYVSSKYLTYDFIAEESHSKEVSVKNEKNKREGMMGRLYINDVGVNVALFDMDVSVDSQHIVDAIDSAAYLYSKDYFGYDLIGDHNTQGFEKIKSVSPYSSVAIIDYGDYSESYICTDILIGYNEIGELTDINRNSLENKENTDIIIYTCNSDGTITITCWEQN